MRIAVVFESGIQSGGGFQQELSTACLLRNHQSDAWEFIYYTLKRSNKKILKAHGIDASYLGPCTSVYWALSRFGITLKLLHFISAILPFHIERIFVRDRIDLVYFLMPSPFALLMRKINYLITVWDLSHLDQPEFPEVNTNGRFEYRELIFSKVFKKAVAILVDSKLGKDNIVKRYGCDSLRVHIAKFLPSIDIVNQVDVDVKQKYSIMRPYIFYPAQFWAHKNHVYILDGLNVLKDKFGIVLDVVFSGYDKGNLKYVLRHGCKLGLEQNIHYVGFVSSEELIAFYKNAIALVMPTYFGPTNIPPLEAFSIGCPVCYSDLPGLRDQVEDAAFLMNLQSPDSMAKQMMFLLDDSNGSIVQDKMRKGKDIVASWTEDDYWNVLDGIFEQYSVKLKCWRG